MPGMVASEDADAVCSSSVARSNIRAIGPLETSTYCMRPYGTTVVVRNLTPLTMSRSSSRVAYPMWYELRPLVARVRGRRVPSRFDLWESSVA